MDEFYQAEHPDPSKQGTRIARAKYDVIHHTMVAIMASSGPIALTPLIHAVGEQLKDTFDGSIPWYVTTVKLDMEAKGELACDRSVSPHLHRLL